MNSTLAVLVSQKFLLAILLAFTAFTNKNTANCTEQPTQ